MNAKLPLSTAVVQFLRVQALVCVYIDLTSLKSLSLQAIGFCQTPSPVLRGCNFYNVNWTLKRWPLLCLYIQYLCCVGMTQHEKYLMQLLFQYQENCQRYLLCSYTTKTVQRTDFFIRI